MRTRLPPRPFSANDIKLLLDATADASFDREVCGVHAGAFWRAYVALSWDTAMRMSEMLDATWGDVTPAGWLHVRANARSVPRYVSPSPDTMTALAAIRRKGDNRLLPWTGSRTVIHAQWRRLLKLAGLGGARVAGLRRSAIKRLVDNAASPPGGAP